MVLFSQVIGRMLCSHSHIATVLTNLILILSAAFPDRRPITDNHVRKCTVGWEGSDVFKHLIVISNAGIIVEADDLL